MKRNDNGKSLRRLALVDDDPAVIASLDTGLGKAFNIVATCCSGEEALKVLSALPPAQFPQIVLLDIKMPGMGGITCCRELRRLFPNLLIAMHTAKPARENFEDARLAGADAYFVKGVALDQLADTLQKLVRREGRCLCMAGLGTYEPAAPEVSRLTKRETEVMDLISLGSGYKQAADHFGCSESNIKKTVARAIRHLKSAFKRSRHPPLAGTGLTCPKGHLPTHG